MRECWLRANLRAMSLGLIPPAFLLLSGVGLTIGYWQGALGTWAAWCGVALSALGALWIAVTIYAMRLPRLGFEDGHLLVYLRSTVPIRVPIRHVECFFLGQAPSGVMGPGGEESETATVVVRLAEAAKDWQHRDVKPALGHWCDGYITIRGTWCEPLSTEVFERLNKRLVEVHRQQRTHRAKEKA